MEVQITSFSNPFSFFCILESDADAEVPFETGKDSPDTAIGTNHIEKLVHGQYIAVLWKNKWVRGIVNMENMMQIWLVDHGIYLRASDKTIWMELSPSDKKIPSRVFEASVHGVLPVDKVVDDECNIVNKTSTTWTKGAIAHVKTAIASASRLLLQPVALLSNTHNDVVLADLYLDIPQKGVVKLLDYLDVWPNILEKDSSAYIENLSKCYKERRRHRACAAMPSFPNLPVITPSTTIAEYSAICVNTPQIAPEPVECYSDTITVLEQNSSAKYTLTPEEYKEYANMYVEFGGREHNLLNVLVNKMRDLSMCEMYQDYDLKCMGRGVYFRRY